MITTINLFITLAIMQSPACSSKQILKRPSLTRAQSPQILEAQKIWAHSSSTFSVAGTLTTFYSCIYNRNLFAQFAPDLDIPNQVLSFIHLSLLACIQVFIPKRANYKINQTERLVISFTKQ